MNRRTNKKLIMVTTAIVSYLIIHFAMYTLCELFTYTAWGLGFIVMVIAVYKLIEKVINKIFKLI